MLFKNLIQNVATDLDIKHEDCFSYIEEMLLRVGLESFTLAVFDKRYSSDLINSFIKHATDLKILDEIISYECVNEGSQEETVDQKGVCIYCDLPILGNAEHETETLYKLNPNISKELFLWFIKEKEQHYIIDLYSNNVDALFQQKKEIVPFIGSGLSMPFGIPNWGGLLKDMEPKFEREYLKETFDDYIDNGELMEGLDFIKNKSLDYTKEVHLQDKIISIIKKKKLPFVKEQHHNYIDLLKFKSNFYITTNYDLILSDVISNHNEYTSPFTFEEIDDVPSLHAGHNQVLHLHGHINKKSSMVVSNESYEKFYNDSENKTKLSALIGSKTLLFLGFSFNDKFFEQLYSEIVNVIGSNHFIVVANPDVKIARAFRDKDLRVIGLNVKTDDNGNIDKDDYVKALKVLIDCIDRSS